MRLNAQQLIGFAIEATDGRIGSVIDLFFDDFAWTLRYLVLDTGRWLPGRRVLIAPEAFKKVDVGRKAVPVTLAKDQVRNSPSIDTEQPVSRQMERVVRAYYHWSPYWTHAEPFLPDTEDLEPALADAYEARERALRQTDPRTPDYEGDRHLRSMQEVTGYSVDARDGAIGRVEDFLIEANTWIIRYLVVESRSWRPGNLVLVSPEWIRNVSWQEQAIAVDLSREQIRNGPEYDPSLPLSRVHEEELLDAYSKKKYWTRGDPR